MSDNDLPSAHSVRLAMKSKPPRPGLTTRRISAEDTKSLRQAVLWPTIARDDQLYPYDSDPRTVQLGAFLSSTPADTDVPDAYLPRGGGKCRAQAAHTEHTALHSPSSSDPCDPTCTPEAAASGDPGSADPAHHGDHHQHAHARQEPCGILTLVVEPYLGHRDESTTFPETQIQLRKFAVIPELQGHGVGRRMLDAAIAEVGRMRDDLVRLAKAEPGPALLHLDARKEQVGFYERVGCKVLDPEVFAKRGAGGQGPAIEHVRMGRIVQ